MEPRIELTITPYTGAMPNNNDIECVDACDDHANSDDEQWWNQCIDTCMERSTSGFVESLKALEQNAVVLGLIITKDTTNDE